MKDATATGSNKLTLPQIIRNIPSDCMQPSLGRSLFYLVRDFAMAVVFAWGVIAVDSWLLGLPLSIFLGLAVGGLFVIAHDCGHRSFCRSERWNNFFGHLTSSITLWPFHVWRMDHDQHHRHTNNVDRDPAWRPVTYRMWKKMPENIQRIYLITRSKFVFLGSIYTTYLGFKDGFNCGSNKRLSDQQKREIRFSLVVTLIVAAIQISLAVYIAGFYGFVYLFLIPQFIFQSQLSTVTFFHHTSPDSTFFDRKNWNAAEAQLAGSIHVKYPAMIEFFWHDINWHVPHHVCVGVPHYKLRDAHRALKTAYPEIVREKVFNWQLVRETTAQCNFIKSKTPVDLSWVSYAEARSIEEQRAAERKRARAELRDLRAATVTGDS